MAVAFIQDRNAAVDYEGNAYVEVACLSTDTKPTGKFLTGSKLFTIDDGETYFFNSASGSWVQPQLK